MIVNQAPCGSIERGEAADRHVHRLRRDRRAVLAGLGDRGVASATAKQTLQCGGVSGGNMPSTICIMPPTGLPASSQTV